MTLFPRIRPGFFAPARDQAVVDAELIADPGDDEVDQVVEPPRAVIPAGHGRQHDRPGPRDRQHVFEMNEAQGRLARDQDQLAPFLEMHVGRAGDQIGRDPAGDRPQRAHAARDDDHSAGPERAAGDPGARNLVMMIDEPAGPETAEDRRIK